MTKSYDRKINWIRLRQFGQYRVKHVLIFLLIAEVLLQTISFLRYEYAYFRTMKRLSNWYVKDKENQMIVNEQEAMTSTYHPFLGWTYNPISTPNNIFYSDLTRKTTNNPEEANIKNSRLFFFGGSTMYGAYVKDNETIPSYVAFNLNHTQPVMRVMNFGQPSYNLNQELIHLLLQLKNGNIPDYVIFYDGCNDLRTSQGQVYSRDIIRDYLGNVEEIVFSYVLPENTSLVNPRILTKAVSFLDTYVKIIHYPSTVARALVRRILPKGSDVKPPLTPDEETELIVDNYVRNVSVIEALAQSYGFSYRLIWQPLVNYKHLTETEKDQSAFDRKNNQLLSFPNVQGVRNKLRDRQLKNFTDLSEMFREYPEKTLFIDECHITPEGNRMVADKLTGIIQDMMK